MASIKLIHHERWTNRRLTSIFKFMFSPSVRWDIDAMCNISALFSNFNIDPRRHKAG